MVGVEEREFFECDNCQLIYGNSFEKKVLESGYQRTIRVAPDSCQACGGEEFTPVFDAKAKEEAREQFEREIERIQRRQG